MLKASYKLLQGDVIERLRELPENSVHCVVTSPPYWGLRDYGTADWDGGDAECDHKGRSQTSRASTSGEWKNGGGQRYKEDTGGMPFSQECQKCGAVRIDQQIGLEKTPAEYLAKMVAVFREVRRVLRSDGTCWVNMGDSYAGSWGNQGRKDERGTQRPINGEMMQPVHDGRYPVNGSNTGKIPEESGLKPKDLVGMPWRLAFALQEDGWVLRQEIIWSKPNPMPESVTDRCTKSHESLFLLCKAEWRGEARRRFAEISDEDARWLAMFLDTEGNICVKRAQASSGTDHFGAQVCFASSSLPLLDEAKRIIGSGTVLQRKGKNAPMFYLQMSNIQAADLLYRVYPFLIVKPRQARLAVHLQNVIANSGRERRTKVGRERGRMRSDAYTDELVKIWATMKELNHFGDPDTSWIPDMEYGRWASCARYFYDAEAIKEPCTEESYRGSSFTRGKTAEARTFPGKPIGVAERVEVSSRNKRSVWEIATEAFPEAHFATFPTKLVEPCILAGTSEKGCCSTCGAPWTRMVESTPMEIDRSERTHKFGHTRSSGTMTAAPISNTTGWKAACKCGAPEMPCTVLDPFNGSGTTGVVALANRCNYIGIELNPDYLAMAERRLDSATAQGILL